LHYQFAIQEALHHRFCNVIFEGDRQALIMKLKKKQRVALDIGLIIDDIV